MVERSDIYWWFTFTQSWNDIFLIREFRKDGIDQHVVTDASSQVRCGGLW